MGRLFVTAMQSIIHSIRSPYQSLSREWYGTPVFPPFDYRFTATDKGLRFEALRLAPALIHPDARPGSYQEELWRYDTAEFFLAPISGGPYLEFNLCPNGAWWQCAFTTPRQVAEGVSLPPPTDIRSVCTRERWSCGATLPRETLELLGLEMHACRLAACAILNSPEQIFLTTAERTEGAPDFHHPSDWPLAVRD